MSEPKVLAEIGEWQLVARDARRPWLVCQGVTIDVQSDTYGDFFDAFAIALERGDVVLLSREELAKKIEAAQELAYAQGKREWDDLAKLGRGEG